MLQHPFIANYSDQKALLGLYREVSAEVVTTVEDLPDDVDSVLDSASTATGSVPKTSVTSLESMEGSVVGQNARRDLSEAYRQKAPNGDSAEYPDTVFNGERHVDDSESEGAPSRGRTGSMVSEDSGQASVDGHAELVPVSGLVNKRKKKISTSGVLSAANAVPLATTGPRKVRTGLIL